MPGKDRSKRAIRLLEQADRCLEALSQILPLPTMTGRGIVVLYDLFDRIEQFPVILKNAKYLGTPPVTAYRSTAQSKGIS